jgi:hypothetical protein
MTDATPLHPEKEMKVTMMLADAALEVGGKMTIAGAGWKVISPNPTPFAVCGWIDVPWNLMNQGHQAQLALLDADGHPYAVPGGVPVALPPDNFSVQRMPGMKPGMTGSHFLVVQVGGLPLIPGETYVWELSINGKTHEEWRLPFYVADAPPQVGGQQEEAA